jgi:hypothetical protein
MELSKFFSKYSVSHDLGNTPRPGVLPPFVTGDAAGCIDELGGKTFNAGVYRVYRWADIEIATKRVCSMFPALTGSIFVFAADWLGQQFAINAKQIVNGVPTVVFYNFGIPDCSYTDTDIYTFHTHEMVDCPNDAVAEGYFKSWQEFAPAPISPGQCVGYKIPLFLGGKDVLENLNLSDMDVYLSVCRDLYYAVRNLPEGTPVDDVVARILDARTGRSVPDT